MFALLYEHGFLVLRFKIMTAQSLSYLEGPSLHIDKGQQFIFATILETLLATNNCPKD